MTEALRSADLLAQLHADLDRHRTTILDRWRALDDPDRLMARPGPKSWSALDCLAHTIRANEMYVGHMARAIKRAETRRRGPMEFFRPGWVGERMRSTLEPRSETAEDGRPRIGMKVKTFGRFDPLGDPTPPEAGATLDLFDSQLEAMKGIAQRMERVDLHVRSNTLLGPFLRLRLGDIARYLIGHADRHFVQAERAMEAAAGIERG